jgi:BCD family chlorophyll transporter-like MFS transporter
MAGRMEGALVKTWAKVGSRRWLPFSDVAHAELPFGRLIRLSMFNLSVGMVQTLFVGTLNRVMIVELAVPASVVAIMLAIPLLAAPFRALVGFRSDTHRSVLGLKRVPYLWLGSWLQFSGLAIMPFALLVLSEAGTRTPVWLGWAGAGLAFLLAGAGAHTTQTAGLALATDVVEEDNRPRVIALMYLMMLLGTLIAALVLETSLRDFTELKLIQVIQATAVFTVVCNLVSLWKQEARQPGVVPYAKGERRPQFREAWTTFLAGGSAVRLLVASGLGFFAFNLQDVLLEPYGGEILGLSVSATTGLTAIMAVGAVGAFVMAAILLRNGSHPIRVAGAGAVVGIVGFLLITASGPMGLSGIFRLGTMIIGFGEGLFGVGTLSTAMALRDPSQHGIALGAWGAVFATAEGSSFAVSGILKDWMSHVVAAGRLGPSFSAPTTPYSVVYVLEIVVLFATIIALAPLVRRQVVAAREDDVVARPFGLADIPA